MIDILNNKLKGTFRTDLVENHLTVDTGKKCRESLAIIEGNYLRILHWNHSTCTYGRSHLIGDLISLQDEIDMKVCLHGYSLFKLETLLKDSVLERVLLKRNLLLPIIKNSIDYLNTDYSSIMNNTEYLRKIFLVENRNSIINDIL